MTNKEKVADLRARLEQDYDDGLGWTGAHRIAQEAIDLADSLRGLLDACVIVPGDEHLWSQPSRSPGTCADGTRDPWTKHCIRCHIGALAEPPHEAQP